MSKVITVSMEDILSEVRSDEKLPRYIKASADYKIFIAAAEELGIKVEPKELQYAVDQFRVSKNLLTADDTQAWMKDNYLSLDDFQTFIHKNVLITKFMNTWIEELVPYFEESRADFTEVVMYETILHDEDLAKKLFNSLKEGRTTFHEVAQQHNQELEMRRSGGYRGVLRRQNIDPEIADAVFAAKPPQLLPPLLTSKGVHLILVQEIIEPELNDSTKLEILKQLMAEWKKNHLEEFEIVVNLNLD